MTTEIVSISPVQGEPMQVHEMREIISQFAGRVMSTIDGYSEQAEHLSGQLGVVVNERDAAQAIIDGLNGEVGYLRSENEKAHAEIEHLQLANSELVRQKADAEYRIKERDDELDHLTGVNLEHESTINNLKKELDQLKTDHYHLSDEYRDLQIHCNEIRESLVAMTAEHDTEKASATFWKDACDKAEAKYWTLENEIRTVRQSLNDLHNVNDQVIDQLQTWQHRAEIAEGVVDTIRGVLATPIAVAA